MTNTTLQHDAPVAVLREAPAALLELLALAGRPVGGNGLVTVVDSQLTEAVPLTRTADLVAVIRDDAGAIRQVVVVEVQRQRDEAKPRAWLQYLAYLIARHEVPVTLLVIAFDVGVAHWAATRRSMGPNIVFTPIVLGRNAWPEVESGGDALAHPELAVLTVLARVEGRRWATLSAAEQQEVLRICQAFLSSEDALLRDTYLSLIEAALDSDFRATLNQFRETHGMQLKELIANAFKAEGKAEGRAEGKAEGKAEGRAEGEIKAKAETLLRLLRRRSFAVDGALELRVKAATVAELDAWLDRVLDAARLQDVFEG